MNDVDHQLFRKLKKPEVEALLALMIPRQDDSEPATDEEKVKILDEAAPHLVS